MLLVTELAIKLVVLFVKKYITRTSEGIQDIFRAMQSRLAKADRHAEGKEAADYLLKTSVSNVM